MKRIFLFLAVFAVATTVVFGQSYASNSAKAEQEIRKLFAASAKAILKSDVAALSNYYADDVTFTSANGNTINKTQFLDFVKKRDGGAKRSILTI